MGGPRRALVTGARGMLGADLCVVLAEAGWQVIPADLAEFDITDVQSTDRFVTASDPSLVVNCAAYTDVDEAEDEPDVALHVNADGARNVARAAAEVGASLVHISTDYVFDGAKPGPYVEDDPPNPLSVYGRSKLASEEAVRETLPEHCIVRTAWLYGLHGKSFPRTILNLALEGQPLRVVNDQRGSPTYTVHLAQIISRIVGRPSYGTYHAVSSGSCTWYQLACAVLAEAGIAAEVTPVTTADFPRPAARPANGALDTAKLRSTFGLQPPRWEEGVREFVARWREERAAALRG